DEAARLALIGEQRAFVAAAVAADPGGQAAAAWRNFTRQLVSIDVDGGFAIDAAYWRKYPRDFHLKEMMARLGVCPPAQAKCAPRLPLAAMGAAQKAVFAAALFYLVVTLGLRLFWRKPAGEDRADFHAFLAAAALIAFAILANAALC